jgi:hypothetical protein
VNAPSKLTVPSVISPCSVGRSPEIAFSVVDLPAPFAPSSVTISPSCTSSEMPFSAWIEP